MMRLKKQESARETQDRPQKDLTDIAPVTKRLLNIRITTQRTGPKMKGMERKERKKRLFQILTFE